MSLISEKEARDRSFCNPDYNALRGFRVTGLDTAEKCLRKWRTEYLRDPSNDNPGKYAKIGTALHVMAEQVISVRRDGTFDSNAYNEAWFVLTELAPKKELKNYTNYLQRLAKNIENVTVLALETEIEIPLGGPKPVYGQVDSLFVNDRGDYYLYDHKTNRKDEDYLDWSRKLQPQLYAFAIAKWLNLPRINFIIGRANFEEDLVWTYELNHLMDIQVRGLNIVNKIHEAFYTNNWPAKTNTDCYYCKINSTCELSKTKNRPSSTWRNMVKELIVNNGGAK